MNFFQHQEDARRKSRLLIALFLLTLAALIFVTALIVFLFLYFFGSSEYAFNNSENFFAFFLHSLYSPTMLYLSLGVTGLVSFGSFLRGLELRDGGAQIAESLGGKPLSITTANTEEKRLLNIVEEMAIATGINVPQVYLLEEPGMNAFAAGFHINEAVIAVTRGALDTLNRDQLQGVIAHEFSHIIHGDMRLNMRLVSLVYGMTMVGQLGHHFIDWGGHYSAGRYRERRAGDIRIYIFGLTLVAVGYIGTVCGRVIKAAVSRQREFLADASAVRFTRNPSGIVGALRLIERNAAGSRLRRTEASEYSHFYFADGLGRIFAAALATHPPLHERIRRIYPADLNLLDAELDELQRQDLRKKAQEQRLSASDPRDTPVEYTLSSALTALTLDKTVSISAPPDLDLAKAAIQSIPDALKEAAHSAYSARALVYALLTDADEAIRSEQCKHLRQRAHPMSYREYESLLGAVIGLPAETKLMLAQLSLPALNTMSVPQQRLFLDNMTALINMDNKVTAFECVVQILVEFGIKQHRPTHSYKLVGLRTESTQLLCFIACLNSAGNRQQAFLAAYTRLFRSDPPAEINLERPPLSSLRTALERLRQLKPLQKPLLIDAMFVAAAEFGELQIDHRRSTVLRALCSILDCPYPMREPQLL